MKAIRKFKIDVNKYMGTYEKEKLVEVLRGIRDNMDEDELVKKTGMTKKDVIAMEKIVDDIVSAILNEMICEVSDSFV